MRLHVWLAAVAALLTAGTAAAQTITVRTLPDEAKRAYMSHVRENVLSLDGVQTKLAPGGQIRGQNNLLVLPVNVPRESLVKYQLDKAGELYRAWILTAEEAARPDLARRHLHQDGPGHEHATGSVLGRGDRRWRDHRRGGGAAGQVPAGERPGPTDRAGVAAVPAARAAALRREAACARGAAGRDEQLSAVFAPRTR